jgi:hypothetical protein
MWRKLYLPHGIRFKSPANESSFYYWMPTNFSGIGELLLKSRQLDIKGNFAIQKFHFVADSPARQSNCTISSNWPPENGTKPGVSIFYNE